MVKNQMFPINHTSSSIWIRFHSSFFSSSSLFPHFFASIRKTYRIWNNEQILTFKVSKWPYWSSPHHRIICKWHLCLLRDQKWNLKNNSTTLDKTITSGQVLVFEVSKQPYQSAQNDRIICKWHQYLQRVQNWNQRSFHILLSLWSLK